MNRLHNAWVCIDIQQSKTFYVDKAIPFNKCNTVLSECLFECSKNGLNVKSDDSVLANTLLKLSVERDNQELN